MNHLPEHLLYIPTAPRQRRVHLIALLLIVAGMLAGCGNSSQQTAASPSATPLATSLPPTATPVPFPGKEFPFQVNNESGANPVSIIAGPDGNLWFTQIIAISQITPTGQIKRVKTSGPGNGYCDITAGPDGNL
ncbi:MAG TPA: hypothetical protein VF099_07285, partial [Ktedonobacterales bacterium]